MKRKTAYLGLFAAVAIIFGYVESLVPVFTGIPGIKLGLANLAVLFILDRYSFKEAALVSVVRILVIGFMFGNLFSILYSLAGAALSLTVMELLKKHSGFSLIGISVAGGVTQYRAADRCHDRGEQYEFDGLCTGTAGSRCPGGDSHRWVDKGGCGTTSFESIIMWFAFWIMAFTFLSEGKLCGLIF